MATDITGLTAHLNVELEATASKAVDLGSPNAVLRMAKILKLAFGAAANQADQIWWDRRAIAGDGNDPLDLAGTLVNALGGTVTFANVKAIVIFNRSDETLAHLGGSHTATDAAIAVGDTSSTFQGPFVTLAKGVTVVAGGVFVVTNPLATGWAVDPDTADILQVDNKDATDEALYDIAIIGESA